MNLNGYGISEYTILIKENADETIVVAANELSEYIFKATGVLLPVAKSKKTNRAFYLDCSCSKNFADEQSLLNNDSFLIKTVEDGIVIKGKNKEGTLFGVYCFLQNYLGVEWYALDCERVMDLKDKGIFVEDRVYNFPAIMRYCHTFEGKNPIFRARHAMTYTVGDINDKASYGNLRGLKFAFSWGLFGHTFEWLLPYEEFFVEHPEWFSFAEGSYGVNHRYQICLTNPMVLKIVTERVLSYLEQYPDCKIISVSQNDSFAEFRDNYCLCDNCKAIFERDGNYSAVMLEFVNQVAKQVAKVRPDVLVHTFAYEFTREAPKTVVPEKNVVIQFCLQKPIGASITDGIYFCSQEKEKFENWHAISNNIFVWTYIADFRHYYLPIAAFRALYEDTIYLLKKGVKGFFQQGLSVYVPTQFGELRSYLTAKMFANPDMTYNQYRDYMKSFCLNYFGQGGEYILEFIDLLEERYNSFNLFAKTKEEQETGKYSTKHKSEDDLLEIFGDENLVAKSKLLFEKAYKLAKSETERSHIEKYKLNADWCEVAKKYIYQEDDYVQFRFEFLKKYLAYGGVEYKENAKIPPLEKLDLSKSPFRFEAPTKTIVLENGIQSSQYFAGDSTCKENYGFGFEFTLLLENEKLNLDLDVYDNDIFVNDKNISDWEQDCVEIFVSETCSRTTKINEVGVYKVRVNANGVYLDEANKVISCKTRKTDNGYNIQLILPMPTEKIGFDIMAHDFSKGKKYLSTRYWNALAFSTAGCPANFGIIQLTNSDYN